MSMRGYPPTEEDLRLRFTYHAPTGDQPIRYERIRAKALELATVLVMLCPPSDEGKRALDKLDEVVMLANAAIARG